MESNLILKEVKSIILEKIEDLKRGGIFDTLERYNDDYILDVYSLWEDYSLLCYTLAEIEEELKGVNIEES